MKILQMKSFNNADIIIKANSANELNVKFVNIMIKKIENTIDEITNAADMCDDAYFEIESINDKSHFDILNEYCDNLAIEISNYNMQISRLKAVLRDIKIKKFNTLKQNYEFITNNFDDSIELIDLFTKRQI